MSSGFKLGFFSFFLVFFAFISSSCFVVITNGASSVEMVADAEQSLTEAFNIVFDAEEADANVSGLLSKLDQCGVYLTDAHAFLLLSDSDNAAQSATFCIELSTEVFDEAVFLRERAEKIKNDEHSITVISSVMGIIIVILSGRFFWKLVKRRYYTEVMLKKPEVNYYESKEHS